LRKLGVVAVILFAVSVVCRAQIPTSGNAFFGYSFSQAEVFTGSGTAGTNMNGWEGSVEGKFLPFLGVVADLDWHYGGRDFTQPKFRLTGSKHNLLFGPRASISVGKLTPFVEFLLGVSHQSDAGGGISNSDTSFATAIGGGLDYKLVKGIAWRVQGDSVHTSLFGGSQNNLRISTGVVFRF
jgi:hypothetical protein